MTVGKEGQYCLCMLYGEECLQPPSAKTKGYAGVDRVPLCTLTTLLSAFLDCLKFFQDFKRCIRLSLQI